MIGLLACAAAPLSIYLAVQLLVKDGSTTGAAADLARLSETADRTMYAARYRAFAVGGSTQEGALVVYRAPGTGFRIDLVGAIELDDDHEMDEIMKGGDILIVINDIKDQSSFQMYSCRTQRRSCRTADGLEILGFVSILGYFSYPLPAVYEQPHTVEEVERISAAGEEAEKRIAAMPMLPPEEIAEAVYDL
ncbi:MAG TPA: hypothetical protein VJP07_10195, partial [Dehalococcoidia bacterium]|nr:hypothetical protein [Dehalococcoidia bacterium]